MYRDFPCIPCSHTCIASTIINIAHHNGTFFFTMNKPALVHHNHPKSIVNLRVHTHFGVLHSKGLGKCIITYIHHYNTIQSIFIIIKILFWLFITASSPPPPKSITETTALFQSPQFYLFQNVIQLKSYNIQLSQTDFFNLVNIQLRFLHVFSWLDSSFPFGAK